MSTRAEEILNIKPVTQDGVTYVSAPKESEYTNCVWGNFAEGETLGDKCQYNSTKNDNNINIDEAYIALEPVFERLEITAEQAKELNIISRILGKDEQTISKQDLALLEGALNTAIGSFSSERGIINGIKNGLRFAINWATGTKDEKFLDDIINKAHGCYKYNLRREALKEAHVKGGFKFWDKIKHGLGFDNKEFQKIFGLTEEDMNNPEKVKTAIKNYIDDNIDFNADTATIKEQLKNLKQTFYRLLAITEDEPGQYVYLVNLLSALESGDKKAAFKILQDACANNQETLDGVSANAVKEYDNLIKPDALGQEVSKEDKLEIARMAFNAMSEPKYQEMVNYVVNNTTEFVGANKDKLDAIRTKIANNVPLTEEEQAILDKLQACGFLNAGATIASFTNGNLSYTTASACRESLAQNAHENNISDVVADGLKTLLEQNPDDFSNEVKSEIRGAIETAIENSKTETSYFSTNSNSQENTTVTDNQTSTNNVSNPKTNNDVNSNTQSNEASTSTSTSASTSTTNTSETGTNTSVYITNTVVNNNKTDETSNPKKENFGLGFQQKMLNDALKNSTIIAKNNTPTSFENCATPEQKRAYRLNIGDEKYYTEVLNSTKKGSDDYTFACKYYEKMTNPNDVFDFIRKLSISALSDVLSNHTSKKILFALEKFGNLKSESTTNILNGQIAQAKEKAKNQGKIPS